MADAFQPRVTIKRLCWKQTSSRLIVWSMPNSFTTLSLCAGAPTTMTCTRNQDYEHEEAMGWFPKQPTQKQWASIDDTKAHWVSLSEHNLSKQWPTWRAPLSRAKMAAKSPTGPEPWTITRSMSRILARSTACNAVGSLHRKNVNLQWQYYKQLQMLSGQQQVQSLPTVPRCNKHQRWEVN